MAYSDSNCTCANSSDQARYYRLVGHLENMSRSPSPLIKTAAKVMLEAIHQTSDERVFKQLIIDYQEAGSQDIADTIDDLTDVLSNIFNSPISYK